MSSPSMRGPLIDQKRWLACRQEALAQVPKISVSFCVRNPRGRGDTSDRTTLMLAVRRCSAYGGRPQHNPKLCPTLAGSLDPPKMSADEIKALELRLTDAGCYKSAIDGQMSTALEHAIKACPNQRPILRVETGMHTATSIASVSTTSARCSRPHPTTRPFDSGRCRTASSSASSACRSARATPARFMRRRCRPTGVSSPSGRRTRIGTMRGPAASRSSTCRPARSGTSAPWGG